MKIKIKMEKLEFIVPEGYEVKEENGKYFAVKRNEEKEWSEFGLISGCYITSMSKFFEVEKMTPEHFNQNVYPTQKEANAYGLVLPQLLQWRNKVNGDWKADWESSRETKWVIRQRGKGLLISGLYLNYFPLHFKTKEIAEQFLKDHKTLLDELIL